MTSGDFYFSLGLLDDCLLFAHLKPVFTCPVKVHCQVCHEQEVRVQSCDPESLPSWHAAHGITDSKIATMSIVTPLVAGCGIVYSPSPLC